MALRSLDVVIPLSVVLIVVVVGCGRPRTRPAQSFETASGSEAPSVIFADPAIPDREFVGEARTRLRKIAEQFFLQYDDLAPIERIDYIANSPDAQYLFEAPIHIRLSKGEPGYDDTAGCCVDGQIMYRKDSVCLVSDAGGESPEWLIMYGPLNVDGQILILLAPSPHEKEFHIKQCGPADSDR